MTLLDALDVAADDLGRVEALAAADLVPSALALGRSITSATDVTNRIEAARWPILLSAINRSDGEALKAQLVAAFAEDELVTRLGPVLTSVEEKAVELLAGSQVEHPVSPPPSPPAPGARRWDGAGLAAARAELDTLAAKVAAGSVAADSIAVSITWTEAEPGEAGGGVQGAPDIP